MRGPFLVLTSSAVVVRSAMVAGLTPGEGGFYFGDLDQPEADPVPKSFPERTIVGATWVFGEVTDKARFKESNGMSSEFLAEGSGFIRLQAEAGKWLEIDVVKAPARWSRTFGSFCSEHLPRAINELFSMFPKQLGDGSKLAKVYAPTISGSLCPCVGSTMFNMGLEVINRVKLLGTRGISSVCMKAYPALEATLSPDAAYYAHLPATAAPIRHPFPISVYPFTIVHQVTST